MADNFQVNDNTSSGVTIAADDISNIWWQKVKIAYGGDDSATQVSDSNPLPVDDAGGSLTVDAPSGTPVAVEIGDGTDQALVSAGGALQTELASTGDVTVSGDALTALQLIDDPVATDDTTTHSTGSTKVMGIGAVATPTDGSVDSNDVAMPAMSVDRRLHVDAQIVGQDADVTIADGGNAITVDGTVTLGANSGVDIGDVDVTSIAAGANLIGDVGIGVRTSGGTSIFRSLDLDESEEEVKATAGQIFWIHAMNLASGTRFLKVYNATAANVTVGSTTPVLTFPLATQGDTNGAGFVFSIPNGVAFGTAITVAATTGVADADTGAPGANEVIVNIGYA